MYYGCGSYYSLLQACRETCNAQWIKKRVDELRPDNCQSSVYYSTLRTRPDTCYTDLAIEFRFECNGYGNNFYCCCEGYGINCR
uniref:Uncharacterized protein n=1 Tax=Tetraselmis sp. GSL018 TaxID=582737 RepID=A0A061SE33_9CHLO